MKKQINQRSQALISIKNQAFYLDFYSLKLKSIDNMSFFMKDSINISILIRTTGR